jgi:beta-mannosidase
VIDLVADGLDTVATVTLNGHEVARTENMFVGFRWDVKRWLRPGGTELSHSFRLSHAVHGASTDGFTPPQEFNDPVGRCTVIRKQQCQFGWDWGPRFVTAGIWRDLRLEAWSESLSRVRLTQKPRADGRSRSTCNRVARPAGNASVNYTVTLTLDGEPSLHTGSGR